MGVNDYIASSAVELAGKENAHVIIHKLSTLHNAGYSASDFDCQHVPPHNEELVWKLGVRAGWPGEEAKQRGRVTLVPVSALDAFPQASVCKQAACAVATRPVQGRRQGVILPSVIEKLANGVGQNKAGQPAI
ncbi:unnamed protein product [Sphagnum jensenii]|uniref:Uncharacterized protein n=1 Tax=Sphagnum jensenii TaxID=128206 RepID=A0ABP1BPC4_9BRYO